MNRTRIFDLNILKRKEEQFLKFSTHPSRISRKDLVLFLKFLKDNLNKRGLEGTIDLVKNYLSKQIYLPYKKHLSGLSHHSKKGPSRRPSKVYKYLIDSLKGFRGIYNIDNSTANSSK